MSNLMRMPSLGSLSPGGSLFDTGPLGMFEEDGADGGATGGWLGASTGAWGAASAEGPLDPSFGAGGGAAPLLPSGAPGGVGPLRCIDVAHDTTTCRVCIAPPEEGEEGACLCAARPHR